MIWQWYEQDFGREAPPASGMRFFSRSKGLRLPNQLDERAELWLRRLKFLEARLAERRNDQEFLKFVNRSIHYFRRAEQHWSQQQVLRSIVPKIEPLRETYAAGVQTALDQTILKATGVSVLEDVMRTLVKVVVIDNLGSSLSDQLASYGYSSNRIQHLSIFQFLQILRKQQPDLQEIDLRQLPPGLFQHPKFQSADLILINPWRFENGKLPLLLLARTSGNLSRREEKALSNHFENQQRLEELKRLRAQRQAQLKALEHQIQLIETENLIEEDDDEAQHYRDLLAERKELVQQLEQDRRRIQDLSRTADPKRKSVLRLINFMDCYARQENIVNKATSMLRRALQQDKTLSSEQALPTLKKLSVFMRQQIRIEEAIARLDQELQQLENQLQDWINQQELKDPPPWRRPFLEYILDRLEFLILREQLNQLTQS